MLRSIVFGVLSGIVTGLLPGIHVNTVVALLLSRTIADPSEAAVYVLALAITHSIVEFVPTAFFGIPDSTTVEASLPAHQLAQEGRSFEALSISILASLIGGVLCLLIAPLASTILAALSAIFTKRIVSVTLALFIAIPVLRSRRWVVALVAACAIVLGFVSLQGNLLMPLLAGLFGVPHILLALRSDAAAPRLGTVAIARPSLMPVLAAVPIGFLFSFLPGAGASTASYFVSRFARRVAGTPERIIALNSALSTVNYATSIYTLAYIGRARNGAVVGIQEMHAQLPLSSSLLVIGCSLVLAAGVGLLLGLLVSRVLPRLAKRGYRLVNLGILAANVIAVLWLSGLAGLVFCAVCALVGSWAIRVDAPKVCLLSCLTGPTLWLVA